MKILLLTLFIYSIIIPAFSQKIEFNPVIEDAVAKIQAEYFLNDYSQIALFLDKTGNARNNPYYLLKEKAANIELIQLTDHASPIVRCAAFRALVLRKEGSLLQIIEQHLTDSSYVLVNGQCTTWGTTVVEFMLDQVNYRSKFSNGQQYISENEVEHIDSLLLYKEGLNTPSQINLFHQISPNLKYYSRILGIVKEENNAHALIALAKYHQKDSKELIWKFLKNEATENEAIEAVREYPLPEFYPYLIEKLEKEYLEAKFRVAKWSILYQALAQYPSHTTLSIFKRGLIQDKNSSQEKHSEYIAIAIRKYPNRIFDGLENDFSFNFFSPQFVEIMSKECH